MNNKGITLVEVLLMVSLFVILIYSSVSLSVTKTSRADLKSKAEEVVQIITQARDFSVAGFWGDTWGIKVLDNDAYCEDSGDCVALFKGKDFEARDSNYDRVVNLNTGVYLEAAEINEFYFEFASGWLSTTTGALAEQGIVLKSNYGEQKIVTTTPTGVVYFGD